jgi:hypothetical protein
MATRISVVKNPKGQFNGWTCKHSIQSAQASECEGHTILCDRCAAAVQNGAELLNDAGGQQIQPAKITTVKFVKRAAAAAGR